MTYGGSTIIREDTTNSALTGARVKFETGVVKHELNAGVSYLQNKSHQAWAFSPGASAFTGNIYGPTPRAIRRWQRHRAIWLIRGFVISTN